MSKEQNKPKWNEEVWHGTTPPDDICCKTCMFKMQPVEICGEVYERHTFGCCDIYEHPETKPHAVLWDKAECEFYEKEKK